MESRKIDTIQKLYHGTRQYHSQIELRCSSDYKDFGRGYYLTSYLSQAMSWAEAKGMRTSSWVFEYVLKEVPDTIQVKELLQYDRDWLDYIIMHRLYGQRDEFDIVYDRMADNKFDVLSQAVQDYANRRITAEAALRLMRFHRGDRDQYCFKTEAAVALLKRTRIYARNRNGLWRCIEREAEKS